MKQFSVSGMSCAACSARVEKAVSSLEGVESCSVNLLTGSMGVEGSATEEQIVAAVVAAGYGAAPKSAKKEKRAEKAEEESAKKETALMLRRLIPSLVLLAVLMYFSMGNAMWGWWVPRFFASSPLRHALLQMLLSAAVIAVNQKFFINGARGLIHRAPNMDTLVALGAAAAFGYSAVLVFVAAGDAAAEEHLLHGLYFESAAMILTLITVGKLLEARSKGKTTDALRALIRLAPKTANVLRGETEVTIPADEVEAGDVFVVRPGESIPADGAVVSGESAVDESALTGESIPVDKAEGDKVSAGTLNRSGLLRCRATHTGEDTALSKIIQMVEDAAASRAPIAKVADKVSGIFVPVVICIAVAATAGWLIFGESVGFALARGISVLVISCPCALGLATPVAIMVGNGRGARAGILFKTAAALEHMGRVNTVALDKTGTITAGTPEVTDIIPAEGVSPERLMRTAASLEAGSEHPLARAVMSYAEREGIEAFEVTAFRALAGNGVSAEADGKQLLGGSMSFIGDRVAISDNMLNAANALAEQGKTPLAFCEGETLLGIVCVADVIKSDSAEAIAELKAMGIRVVMLTGDNDRTAKAIGSAAGVDEVVSGVLPDGKAAHIQELRKSDKVAMVGDGINDAPALTAADIGVAIGAGTDVAIDAADVVLMHSTLADVVRAVRLGRATLRNIRENLFWAFFYNAIGIPLAAGLFVGWLGWELNPMFGAAAMSLSSFCVVSNALRLNFVNIEKSKVKTKKEKRHMKKTMKIEGMMCPHCEAHVKKALEAKAEVAEAAVSHKEGTAIVTLSAELSDAALRAAVEAEGYKVISIN